MALRLFLSAVSDDYKPLRTRFGDQLRTGGFMVILQDEFPEIGVNTPVKLAEFIERESDVVLHLVGPRVGSVPGKQEVEELLRHCGRERLHQRFPQLFEGDAYRRVTYTQWEAWLGLFYGKRVLIFEATDSTAAVVATAAPADGKPMPMSVEEHIQLVKGLSGWAKSFTDEASLIIAAQTSLARILNTGAHHQDRPCHLPYSTLGDLFIGRDRFLGELREKFLVARAAGRWPNQAVCGVGGLGKTQVAIEYALRNRDEYSAVLMVNADTPESLRSGLAGLAGILHSNLDPAMPDDAKEQATLQWLKRNPGWLLIVDNADTEPARNEVTRRLAQWSDGHVLITARYHQWPKSVEALDLHVLHPDDAAKFLMKATDGKRVQASDDPQQARLLASDDLDGLCLALEQAAAYIEERQITFAEYRRRWAENQKEARTWADKDVMQYHTEQEVSLSVATTWLTTFRELTPAAQTLLQMLAWLSPEPIPRALLQHPDTETEFQSLQPGEDIETALAALRRYSLLSHRPGDPSDSAGRVHRVVQLITRERLPAEEQKTSLMATLQAVNSYTPDDSDDVRTWPVLEPLRSHLTTIIEFADKADIAEPTTRLLSVMGGLLMAKALYREAELLLRRSLAIDEQCYGAEHPKVAIRLGNLAQLLQDTNRLAEAEPMMRRALAIGENTFGAEHPKVATRLSNLAQLLKVTNRLAEAEPLMRRALAIDEQFYGAKHPDFAIDLNNLADLLKATNRLTEAEPLMARVVTIFEKSNGENHPNVAVALNNLALLLQATNRLAEAEPLMRRALAIDEQSYGAEHPDVARDLNNLAFLLQAKADEAVARNDWDNRSIFLAEAEPLARRAVKIFQKSLGDQHPSTITVRENHASILSAMEDQ